MRKDVALAAALLALAIPVSVFAGAGYSVVTDGNPPTPAFQETEAESVGYEIPSEPFRSEDVFEKIVMSFMAVFLAGSLLGAFTYLSRMTRM